MTRITRIAYAHRDSRALRANGSCPVGQSPRESGTLPPTQRSNTGSGLISRELRPRPPLDRT